MVRMALLRNPTAHRVQIRLLLLKSCCLGAKFLSTPKVVIILSPPKIRLKAWVTEGLAFKVYHSSELLVITFVGFFASLTASMYSIQSRCLHRTGTPLFKPLNLV